MRGLILAPGRFVVKQSPLSMLAWVASSQMVIYAPFMISARQCRMARVALGWSGGDLAARARVGLNTVSRFEQGGDARPASIQAMRQALEGGGVIFLAADEMSAGAGEGVRLRT